MYKPRDWEQQRRELDTASGNKITGYVFISLRFQLRTQNKKFNHLHWKPLYSNINSRNKKLQEKNIFDLQQNKIQYKPNLDSLIYKLEAHS